MRFSIPASIRFCLIILILVAVLPALGIMAFSGYTLKEIIVDNAKDRTLRQIQAMAAHHERVVHNAQLLLTSLSKARVIQELDADACQNLLTEIGQGNKAYAALALADTQGQIVVSVPQGAFTAIQDQKFFSELMQRMDFVMGAYHKLPESQQVVMEFAQPVLDQEKNLVGVLVASFDLSYFGQIFSDAHLPTGSVFTLTDAQGMRLTRFPETEKYTWVPDFAPMLKHMTGPQGEGTFLETGIDGVLRLYAFKRLHFENTPLHQLMIRVGLPEDLALAEARRAELRNFIFMLLTGLFALSSAWLVGKFAILNPMQQLIAATDLLGAGNLKARTRLEHNHGELGRLAAAFDHMAESLEYQDYNRRVAEEECCQLNTELEQRVLMRTAELAQTNKELQTALKNLHQAQDQLVMSEKLAALGGLVAGIAHEINTPVGVALSATSTMVEKTRMLTDLFVQSEMKRSDLTAYLDASREGMEMSLLNLHRASDLIRSFKMVAADQVSGTRRSFNVKEYIDEILLSLRPKLKKTTHKVEVECDDELVIESYPGAISQILTNLIVNSLTHAFDAEESGLIRITVSTDKGTMCLTYADNGHGIPIEVQNKIFEPFYTTARSQGSTGLGLHIVFNIVQSTLKGTITFCSSPEQGTTFQICIPLNKEAI
ncbi:MAG: ATP-binding protein [Desulfomicrobium sp.]|nr:ATP-binding protein [Desulfomicrobium sp.]NLV96327.1 HAMP domain-containing protein [Desulfovibrionales bacterium]